MQIHIDVTQEDIDHAAAAYVDAGSGLWTQTCPIAQALQRQVPGYDWRVDPKAGRNIWIGAGYYEGVVMPVPARRFAAKWDRSYKRRDRWPEPFAFDFDIGLPLPDHARVIGAGETA